MLTQRTSPVIRQRSPVCFTSFSNNVSELHGLDYPAEAFDSVTKNRSSLLSDGIAQSGTELATQVPHLQLQIPVSRADSQRTSNNDGSTLFFTPTSKKGTESQRISRRTTDEKGVMIVAREGEEQRYYGPSSFVSILSSGGLSWIESQTAEPSSRRLRDIVLRGEDLSYSCVYPTLQRSFSRDSTVPLPPLPEALTLIQEYLDLYNHVLPIFHPPTVVTLLGQQYSEQTRKPGTNSAWWVSLNAMLAIAQRRRVELRQCPKEDMNKVWGYVQNAMDVLLDVTLRCSSLTSVQALLVMALFFLGTPNPQASFSLTGCALRNAQVIGLHITVSHPNLSVEQVTQRKRVFWVTAILEQAASHRAGRSATLALQDREIDLPPEIDGDKVGVIRSSDGLQEVNLFRIMTHLAVIESKVFHRLYCPLASGLTGDNIAAIIEELDRDLKLYKKTIPASFELDHLGDDSWSKPFHLEMARVHLEYYYCTIIIHRIDGHRSSRLPATATATERGTRGQVAASSIEECLSAARATIQLMKRLPRRVKSLTWISSYIPLAALVVLFINTLQQPLGPEAVSDLKAIQTVIDITSDVDAEDVQFIQARVGVMTEFLQLAHCAVKKASARANSAMAGQDHSRSYPIHQVLESQGSSLNSEIQISGGTETSTSTTSGYSSSRQSELVDQSPPIGLPVETEQNTSIFPRADNNIPDSNQYSFAMNDIQDWYNDPSSTEWATDLMSMSLPFPWDWQQLSEMPAHGFNV